MPPTPEPRAPRGRQIAVIVLVVVAIPAAAVGAWFLRDAMWRSTRRFDADVWRDEATVVSGRSERHRMADEVRARLLRERPTREAVHTLLGAPCFTSDGDDWYTLGTAPGLTVTDDCGLQVSYGADDDRVDGVLAAHQGE